MALALVVSLVLTRQFLVAHLDQRIDAELANEASDIAAATSEGAGQPGTQRPRPVLDVLTAALAKGPGEPESGALALLDGRVVGASRGPAWVRSAEHSRFVQTWSAVSGPTFGTIDTTAGPVRYLARPVTRPGAPRQGVIVTLTSLRREAALISEVTRLGAETGAAALILASLIAWLVAGRLLRPVRDVTELARSISESDLSRRIPVRGSDEVSALAETFNGMLSRLDAAFGAQRAFIQDASHELRTPITIVRGQLEVMGDDPNERAETMALVFDELDRMDRLVRDLLTLASLAKPHPLQRSAVPIAPLVESVFAKATALGPRRWELKEDVGEVRALVDHQRVTQALLQLATNAVQHTHPGDSIVFGAVYAQGELRLSVQDSGEGLAAEDCQRIFDRFTRVGNGRSVSDGAGLGLAIVRAIAEAHDGTVELVSTPGGGSTFTLILPVVAVPIRSGPSLVSASSESRRG